MNGSMKIVKVIEKKVSLLQIGQQKKEIIIGQIIRLMKMVLLKLLQRIFYIMVILVLIIKEHLNMEKYFQQK
jgi:hypothetical protein